MIRYVSIALLFVLQGCELIGPTFDDPRVVTDRSLYALGDTVSFTVYPGRKPVWIDSCDGDLNHRVDRKVSRTWTGYVEWGHLCDVYFGTRVSSGESFTAYARIDTTGVYRIAVDFLDEDRYGPHEIVTNEFTIN